MPPRKRANAFEDFPFESQVEVSKSEKRHKTLNQDGDVERIQRLIPSKMMPDRYQPRRILPSELREEFYRGYTSCYDTARKWIELSRKDKGMAEEIERLIQMGETLDEHGQIKPITGSWKMTESGEYLFIIETGERRFWAACLKYVKNKEKVEPRLRIEEVKNPTRQRQVLENRHAEPPSAVEQACEVASLILAEQGIQPDATKKDDYDYFRQAREGRMPVGLWDKLIPIMQLTRPRMVQLLNILQLPSHLLDMADRYRVPERVLREILTQPSNHWQPLIEQAAFGQLTSDDVAALAEVHKLTPTEKRDFGPEPVPEPARIANRYLFRLLNLIDSQNPETQS
ncbi:MAG TPA: hypothetical protein PKD55_11525, partial [Bellilinea sp.]|nr:hypothetical protein [Bellilinea sp.]